ncbi:acyltransferase [Amedibacillus sp. YH-ame6]
MRKGFYELDELREMGFKSLGVNVLISTYSIILSPEAIEIGNNVRIDAFSILSGKIVIHNNVHIAVGCSLFAGDAGIELCDFTGLSSKVSVYAVSDDYSGDYLTNPTVPEKFKHVKSEKVCFEKHTLIGASSVVLPGVVVGEGTSVGAMSLIVKSLDSWGMYAGIPVRKLKCRSKKLLELEEQYLNENNKK